VAPGGGGWTCHVPHDDGDRDVKCPTEIGITDRREAELSGLGFLPICHYKNTDYAVFFGAQSTQKPKKYDSPDATANAAISARLPYIMATSRFAHYLKIMGRDKIGQFMEGPQPLDHEPRQRQPRASQEIAKYRAEARVEVKEIPSPAATTLSPGSAACRWRVVGSLRMVASIPKAAADPPMTPPPGAPGGAARDELRPAPAPTAGAAPYPDLLALVLSSKPGPERESANRSLDAFLAEKDPARAIAAWLSITGRRADIGAAALRRAVAVDVATTDRALGAQVDAICTTKFQRLGRPGSA
jgi:hypothetical protein